MATSLPSSPSAARRRQMTRRLAPLGLCAALAVGAVACSKSDDSADSKTSTTTTVKQSDGSDTSSADGTDTTNDAESGSKDSGSDSGASKGDGSKVTLVDGEASAANTITFDAQDSFNPSELTVPVGEKVTFKAAPDAGTHAVRFGSSTDTFTISGGLIETFTISAPGTYTVTEDLTNATMTLKVT